MSDAVTDEQLRALKGFARWVVENIARIGNRLDDGDVQDEALKLGIIEQRTALPDNLERWGHLEDIGIGDPFYVFADWMKKVPAKDKSDESAATQWRPIDVEPSHAMRVLLFRPADYDPDWNGADYGISVGYFSNGEWRDQGTNHDAFEYTAPTHWMPLPPPPEDKSDKPPEGKVAIEGEHEASKS